MKCAFNIDFKTDYPQLHKLQTYYGNNITQFIQTLNSISELTADGKRIPSAAFVEFLETKNATIDFTNEKLDFNTFKQYIKEFESINKLSLNNIKLDVNEESPIIKHGYPSGKAREDAKKAVTHKIIEMLKNAKFGLIANTSSEKTYDRTITEELYDRACFIAEKQIANSKLDIATRNAIRAEIKSVTTEYEVRMILSKHKGFKSNFDIYKDNNEYILRSIKRFVTALAAKRITSVTDMTEKEAMANLVKGRHNIDTIFKDQSINDETLLSLFYEVVPTRFINKTDSTDILNLSEYNAKSKEEQAKYKEHNTFFEELVNNPKLKFIKPTLESYISNEDVLAVDAVNDIFGEDNLDETAPSNDDVDITITMYDHSGSYTKAMTHVKEDVKLLLDSVPLTNSTITDNNTLDYNLDNSIGLPINMDGNYIATLLFHRCDPTDINAFINSIKFIAESVPGAQGMIVLYKQAKENRNIANALYTTFAKFKINKVELREENGVKRFVISNTRSSRIDAFRMQLFNSLRNNIPNINKDVDDIIKTNIANIKNEIKKLGKWDKRMLNMSNEKIKQIVLDLSKNLRYYYSNLDPQAIENYVVLHKQAGESENQIKANLTSLCDFLISINDNSRKAYNNYITNKNNSYNAWQHNENLKREAAYLNAHVDESQLIDLEQFRNIDFLDNSCNESVITLSNALEPYSNIQVDNNSINPKGNQSSDIINNSYLTSLKEMLKDVKVIEDFGKYRFLSKQYNFSNILLEDIDENNNRIYGLFRKEGNVYKVTEYAQELLDVALYNGARSYTNDGGITYPEHSKPDYLLTMFTGFNAPYDKHTTYAIQSANYLLRTPSDAPKNFTIRAPKYSVDKLFTLTTDSINTINDLYKNIIARLNNEIADNKTDVIKVKDINTFINHAINTQEVKIRVPNYLKSKYENKENQEITIFLEYNDEGADQNNSLTIKGKYVNGVITGTVIGTNKPLSDNIKSNIRQQLINNLDKDNKLTKTINTKHVLFTQLKREFRQELLDMAIALDKFFNVNKTADTGKPLGFIQMEDDIPKWKDGVVVSKDGTVLNNPGTYEHYHHKKGKIFEVKDNKINLLGNVFHSNKFIVWDSITNTNINYGERIIQEAFDIFYGGAKAQPNHLAIKLEDGNIVDVDITKEQEAIIDNHIEQFINHLIKDSIDRLVPYEHIVGKNNITYNNVAEVMLNYHIMYNNFDTLFEGDSKFYKDAETFLKRAKEVQGSGVPYSLVNYSTSFNTVKNDITKESPLSYTTFAGNHKISQYDKFTGVTIVNTIRYDKSGLKLIENRLVTAGISKGKAKDMMKPFTEAKVNDAQSYITFEEWIRRITARGQLPQYTNLINKIYTGEQLSGSELTEFVQVQKNFYYNQDFDEHSTIFAPQQIKNAEFVLIPQLIKGTELEVVAELMKKHGIDQLNTAETSKAGKSDILEIFDSKTGKVRKDIIDEIRNKGKDSEFTKAMATNRGKRLYSYSFLYTQQETPQHLADKNKAGIQLMKKILDNITSDNADLYKYKTRFVEAYCANIKDSANTLFKELNLDFSNVVTNDNGELVILNLNYDVFYDKLKTEIFRLGYDSNLLDYVTLNVFGKDSNNNLTIMPNYMSMVETKLESIAQSIFNNNITRQTLPGFHAAQITNVGFDQIKGYDIDENKVTYAKHLKYHEDDNGNYVDYVEIMLPASAFNFKRRNADGSLKSERELLKELQNAGLDNVIGYRIPTEGKQSICKMKIVGLLPDACGSTIVVPDAWVAQTGSDFDIDSVYGVQYSTYIDENGQIQRHKLDDTRHLEDNSREARNNEILDCIMHIIGDDASLEEIMSRSNFEDVTSARNSITSDMKSFQRRKNRITYNPLDQADYMNDAMSGAKLKGFSVSRDNFCSICNTVRPTITDENRIPIAYSIKDVDVKQLKARYSTNCIEVVGDKIIIRHNTIGWSNDNRNVIGKLLTAYSSQTTAHILDIIKEGPIPNVNDYSFGVYKLFPDIGSDYTTAIAFMMQKGVTRIVEANDAAKSIFTDTQGNPIYKAIRDIAKELGLSVDEWTPMAEVFKLINDNYKETIHKVLNIDEINLLNSTANELIIDSEKLIGNLKSPVEENHEQLIYELGTILQFNKLKQFADSIGDLVRVCNPDKFGAKQSIYETNETINNIEELAKNKKLVLEVREEGKDPINFIRAIYPGIENGFTGYLNDDNDNDSRYKILHMFLKYATSTSIAINRTLFPTETHDFRAYINGLTNVLTDSRKLTNKQRTNFKRYVIGMLYDNAKCLTLPVRYNLESKEFVLPEITFSLDPSAVNESENGKLAITDIHNVKDKEKERIFGYNRTPELTIPNENGEDIEFGVSNINNPTQEELDNFAKLTPAQKIEYIKNNIEVGTVFDAFEVNLYTIKSINGKKAGSQTITFNDDIFDIEDVYIQLNNALNNSNPLVAMATYDLIKYAFVVEGYFMTKRGISKAIPNKLLYKSLNDGGIGLIDELTDNFTNFKQNLQPTDLNSYTDYVRSHSDSLRIPTKYVQRHNKKYELSKEFNGAIVIKGDLDVIKDLLVKYKIASVVSKQDTEDLIPNQYVKLKYGKKEADLYKIYPILNKGVVILYPLNKLEENEHGTFSANPNNWTHPREEYYINWIQNEFSSTGVLDGQLNNLNIAEYRRKLQKVQTNKSNKLDLTKRTKTNEVLYDNIEKGFINFLSNNGNKDRSHYYFRNNALDNYIKENKINGSINAIFSNKDGVLISVKIDVVKKEGKKTILDYVSDKDKELPEDKKHLIPIVEQLREEGIKNLENANIYTISLNTSGLKYSTRIEGTPVTINDVVEDIYFNADHNTTDKSSVALKSYWKKEGITKENVTENIDTILKSGARDIITRINEITNKLSYFIKYYDETYIPVDDPRVIDMIEKDPVAQKEYIELLLEAESLVKQYSSVIELDIDAQDDNFQTILNELKSKLKKLQDNESIRKAYTLYVDEILKRQSTNPLIRENIISILNGFYSTDIFDAWVGDIQESSNPLIQIITKEISTELYKSERQASKAIFDFRNKIKDIRKRANANGYDIDFKNIIDEDGRLIQHYDKQLLEDMQSFENAIDDTYTKYSTKKGTYKDYLKAVFAYDEWKLKHIHRRINDDYYREKLELERYMLFGHTPTEEEARLELQKIYMTETISDAQIQQYIKENTNPGYPDIYAKYKELKAKRYEVYKALRNGSTDPHYTTLLDEINKELSRIVDFLYLDPVTETYQLRKDYAFISGTPEEQENKRLHSASANNALRTYIANIGKLNKKYFTDNAKFGFEEELKKHKATLLSYEKRDANGNITVPMSELMKHEEYVKAKQWLADNAKFVVSEELQEELQEAFNTLSKGKTKIALSKAVENHSAKDPYGVIDARDFTDEEIDAIKDEEIRNINYNESSAYSDRSLIKNQDETDVVYTTRFYNSLKVDGKDNIVWYKTVNLINAILEKYWDNSLGIINFDLIPHGNVNQNRFNEMIQRDEFKALRESLKSDGKPTEIKTASDLYIVLAHLYNELADTKKKEDVDKEDVKRVINFRTKNVSTELSPKMQAEFDRQERLALAKGDVYYNLWKKANVMVVEEVVAIDENTSAITTKSVPNPYIYGSLKPKEEVKDKFIDKKKTKALNTIHQAYDIIPTQYYYAKYQEMHEQGDAVFNDWYYRNHIYDPNTRTYKPIKCWTQYVHKEVGLDKGHWVPKWNNIVNEVKDKYKNTEYKENVGNAINYKPGTGYDNTLLNNQNEYEKEFANYIQDLLRELVKVEKGRTYINNGYMPAINKAAATDSKLIVKELLKTLGWYVSETGKEEYHDKIGHEFDEVSNMPFLALLNQKKLDKSQYVEPIREDGESDESFNARMATYKDNVQKLKEENAKAHREAINTNWEEVIEEFIKQAYKFNTIQDVKHKLYFSKRLLSRLETYKTKYGAFSDLDKDYKRSTETNPKYKTSKADNERLEEQLDNWIRRILFNEWKEPKSSLTKWAARLQSLTSAQYMMMNIRGGIANISIGSVQIAAETAAGEYLSRSDFRKGVGLWSSSILSQLADMNSDISSNVVSAIIKTFNVIDYDRIFEKSNISKNSTSKAFNTATNILYSPQGIGENYMQNSVLLAMLLSHKIVKEYDHLGNQIITFKNIQEYRRDSDIKTLRSMIKDTELLDKFNNYIETIKKDPNALKDFAWYKKDVVTDFIKEYIPNRKQEYIEARQKLIDKVNEDFASLPTVMSELILTADGRLGYKEDGELSRFDVTNEYGQNATENAIANFRNRVISVNKKLHGVYDKLGAGQVEKKWFGGLLMQYHKHIYPGILKRWRIKGMYNESRGTIEKGYYTSLIQFLGTPIRDTRNSIKANKEEITAIASIQEMFKNILDFCLNIGVNYDFLPEYEQSNIRRNIGDALGLLSGILLVMVLRAIGDDKDEDSIWYNLALYEADRLASESIQFNPKGLITQAKSLWSTPIAAQSGLQDIISTMGFISDWLMDEDFDPYYRTGRFAGENKFVVRLKRRIPIYRGIHTGLFDIKEHNQYYKLGKNVLDSPLIEETLDWIDEKFD